MKFYCRDSFPNGRLGHSGFQHPDGKRLPERQPFPGAASTASPTAVPWSPCLQDDSFATPVGGGSPGGRSRVALRAPASEGAGKHQACQQPGPRPRDILTHFFNKRDFFCPLLPVSPQPLGSHR